MFSYHADFEERMRYARSENKPGTEDIFIRFKYSAATTENRCGGLLLEFFCDRGFRDRCALPEGLSWVLSAAPMSTIGAQPSESVIYMDNLSELLIHDTDLDKHFFFFDDEKPIFHLEPRKTHVMVPLQHVTRVS